MKRSVRSVTGVVIVVIMVIATAALAQKVPCHHFQGTGTLAAITIVDDPLYVTLFTFIDPGQGSDVSVCDLTPSLCSTVVCRSLQEPYSDDCSLGVVGDCYTYFSVQCGEAPEMIRSMSLLATGACPAP